MTAKHTTYIQLVILALISALISGCSVRLQNYKEIVTELVSSPEDVTLSPQEIEEFPYAGSYIQLTERPRAFMALAFDDKGVLKWRTGGDEIIHTKHGRITATNNMSGAITHTSNLENDPLACIRLSIKNHQDSTNCPSTWRRDVWVTTATPKHISDSLYHYESTFSHHEKQQLTLATGATFEVIKVEETNDQFTNIFYIDTETARIVRSQQLIAPPNVYATIEEVKPYTNEVVSEK